MDHMTAKVSCFARAYHYKNNREWVFADPFAAKMLRKEEYDAIGEHMAQGISFFAPDFDGAKEDALRFIVEHQLAPSVLARSAFCEKALQKEMEKGCGQYAVFAAGFDTFGLRHEAQDISVYELDLPDMIAEKRQRIADEALREHDHVNYVACDLSDPSWMEKLLGAGFHREHAAFASLQGISYYLAKEDWRRLLCSIGELWKEGSCICFDYPRAQAGDVSQKNEQLAAGAGERMQARYTPEEMEKLLESCGFSVREHRDHQEITSEFFAEYNRVNPEHSMHAPEGVGYILAVRKR